VDQWGVSHKDAAQQRQLYQEERSRDSLHQSQTGQIFKWQSHRTPLPEHCQTQNFTIRLGTYRRKVDDYGKFQQDAFKVKYAQGFNRWRPGFWIEI